MMPFKPARPTISEGQRAHPVETCLRLKRPRKPGPRALVVLACSLIAPALQAADAGKADLEVQVIGLRNGTGQVGCQVFASASGFPRNNEQAMSGVFAPITAGTARCVFKDLPSGSYAVSVMHDENGNKKLDSNFFGVPSEGYGASNNRTYAMSPPKWEESRFELAESEKKSLSISLRY